MTCKDCIKFDVCGKKLRRMFPDTEVNKPVCRNFADKSRLVELPCKVGDKVYCIKTIECDDCMLDKCRGWTLAECPKKILELPFKPGMLERIGKTVFLTREEAEKALKEREVR